MSFCMKNAIKNETDNVNENSLLRLMFLLFLIFGPLELQKRCDVANLKTEENLKKFHLQGFFVSYLFKPF